MKVWSRLFNFQIWQFWGIHLKFQQRHLFSFRLKKVKPGSACCFASQLVLFSSRMENYDLERYSDTWGSIYVRKPTTLMTNQIKLKYYPINSWFAQDSYGNHNP